MNNRRKLIVALGVGVLATSLPALAQQEKRVRRIGFLSSAGAKSIAANMAAFREGMLELRWVEGRDYVIDARYANGVSEAVPDLAAEAVASQPDLLLSTAELAVRELAQRAKTIPIVFTIAQDPVKNGLAASLQRPGGNVTGLTSLAAELGAKRLDLLKQAFPRVAHVVVLFSPDNAGSVSQAKEIEAAAKPLGMRFSQIELRQPADIESAFKRGTALGAQAYIVTQNGVVNSQRQLIVDRIARLRVPASFPDDLFVAAGGLMSYAPSQQDNFRRAATYVDKILKGAKPGDLPIEQPTKFEFVINMKTAKSLGIKIPNSVLVQATKVIE